MKIPYSYLRALLMFAADKREVRTYLQGVAVESTGEKTILTASNGHVLGRLLLPSTCPKSRYQLSGSLVRSMLALARTKTEQDTPFDVDFGDIITVKHLDSILTAPAEACLFPDFNRIIPDAVTGELAQYDPEYMAVFSKAGRALAPHRKSAYPVFYHNGIGPGMVGLEGHTDFFGIIMPWGVTPIDPQELLAGFI